jgi:hypothetical protein
VLFGPPPFVDRHIRPLFLPSAVIDCVDFRIQPFAEHLASVLANIFALLEDVEDDDTKMAVFNTLGIVLQRGKLEVCMGVIANPSARGRNRAPNILGIKCDAGLVMCA